MKTIETGVVVLKNEKDEVVAVIYKDGSKAPVVLMTEVASVEDLVELIKPQCKLKDYGEPVGSDEAHDNEGDGR